MSEQTFERPEPTKPTDPTIPYRNTDKWKAAKEA
jgi:hypothetical protein